MAASALRGIVLALAMLVGLVAAPAPARACHAGPLAGQWHFDEIDAVGDATPDSSGHGLDATTSPQANLVPGRFGNAYDPVDFSEIRVLDNPVLETPTVTVVAWVRRFGGPNPADPPEYVLGKGAIACEGSSYALYSGVDGTGNLRFQIYDGTRNHQSPSAPGAFLWDGGWHMVAGTYDGAAVRLYVDGTEVGAGTATPGAVAYGLSDDTLSIGSYPNDSCASSFFNGGIDEPRVYGRALSASEIARLAAHPGPDPPVLVPDADPQPPPGGGDPSPGGDAGTGAPTAEPPPPSAAFTPSLTSARLRQFVRFDASQSFGAAGIERFDWDLNGDGRPEARCDGSNPIMEAAFVRPSTGVSLTVTDARGRTASARVPLSVGGTRRSSAGEPQPAQRRPSRRLYQVAECLPGPGSPGRDITANGGPDALCRQQVHYAGLIEAIGCWDRLESRADLPRSERTGLNVFLEREFNSIRGTTRDSAAQAARLPGSIFDAIDEEWVDRVYASTRPVRINGLDFEPRGGARIVLVAAARGAVHRGAAVLPSSSYIVSRNAKVMLGDVELKSGPVRVRVDVPDARLANLQLPRSIRFLPAMPLTGSLDVTLIDRATRLGVNVMLPRYLGGVTARSTVTTTNAGGFGFDGLELHVGELLLGGSLTIEDVDFKVSNARSGISLSAAAKVFLPPPRAGASIEGALKIVNGVFDRLSLTYSPGAGQGIPVGPGVFLTSLGGSFQLDPTEIGGEVTVGFGQSVGGGCPPAGVTGTVLLHLAPGPVSFDARGEGSLFCLPFAQATAFLHVDGNGYVAVGGRLEYDFAPVFSLGMDVNARFLFPHLTAEGAASACIFDKKLCGGVDALISDKGAAVCATLVEGFGVRIRGGLGFDWPPPAALTNHLATAAFILNNLRPMATSCDVGPWRTVAQGARAAQAGPRTFQVQRGQPGFALALTGAGEAPRVTLRGPGGREIVVPDEQVLRSGRDFAARVPSEATTYLVVGEPAPGTWTIAEHEGSPPITGLRQAGILPPPRVRGRIARGRGDTRVLRYRVEPIPGQVVRFVEEAPGGSRELARARGSRGSIRFRPSDAHGTRRKIVALVEQSGLPRDSIDVTAYTARPPRVGRPRRLRVRRRGTRLIVTWRRPSNATHHLVRVNLSDGRRLLFQTGRRARVTVPGVGRRARAGISVAGRRGVLRPGPAARVSVRGRR